MLPQIRCPILLVPHQGVLIDKSKVFVLSLSWLLLAGLIWFVEISQRRQGIAIDIQPLTRQMNTGPNNQPRRVRDTAASETYFLWKGLDSHWTIGVSVLTCAWLKERTRGCAKLLGDQIPSNHESSKTIQPPHSWLPRIFSIHSLLERTFGFR